jgi:TP53 regulating kinase-like protein
VPDQKILYQGAEAIIQVSNYLERSVVMKQRLHKRYRLSAIDTRLISSRTREEAKLMKEARHQGVCVPLIYDVDLQQGVITMEYVQGQRVKDIFNDLSPDQQIHLCRDIGENIAKLHNHNIIHGDLTTSNMILRKGHLYFIDFGLGEKNSEIEAKGVDLHVLMEAIESTHSIYASRFTNVLEGYRQELKEDAQQVIKKIQDIVKRGRYR